MKSLPRHKSAEASRKRKFLLGQLNSNGDCLYATTVARQIKRDYPGCHLTWAIGSMCRQMIVGNPDVDEIWEIPLSNIAEVAKVWKEFESEVHEKKRQREFEDIFLTQISPGNLHHYDGIIRSSIFRGYPHKITVPVTPVLRLSDAEVKNVRRFADIHHLSERAQVILFECSPKSGQSFVTQSIALEIARKLVASIPNACVILSSNKSINSGDERIIDGSVISLRENAELSKYCTLLVGCSSGVSWTCTSDWAKPLPMVQLLKNDVIWFNSFVCDHERWGLPTRSIIEMLECSTDKVSDCIIRITTDGFAAARELYHNPAKVSLKYFLPVHEELFNNGKYFNTISFCLLNIKSHGLQPLFITTLYKGILTKLKRLLHKLEESCRKKCQNIFVR